MTKKITKKEAIETINKFIDDLEYFMFSHSERVRKKEAYEECIRLIQKIETEPSTELVSQEYLNKLQSKYQKLSRNYDDIKTNLNELRKIKDDLIYANVSLKEKVLRNIEPVELPKLVAEFLEEYKGCSISFILDKRRLYPQINKWMTEKNQKIFARAWLDGYVVKKEPKYIVKIGKMYFVNGTINPTFTFDKNEASKYVSKTNAEFVVNHIGGEVEEIESE